MKNENVIAIADDDPAILDAMKMILELYDFTVETIADGLIFPKLATLKPKLLFLDICMSGVDGGEVCKVLKTSEATKDIPIVMISASCDLIKKVKKAGEKKYFANLF